jgi:hypothetical protein
MKRPSTNALVARACICKRFRGPGIDSEEAIPPAYVAWRASTINRVIIPARQARNRFLGFLKGLQIRAQHCTPPRISPLVPAGVSVTTTFYNVSDCHY